MRVSSLPKRELSKPQDHVLTDSQAKPGRDSRDGAVERRTSIPKPGLVTKAELAEHGKSSPEPWTAIKGVVYDLSAFLSKHPGGRGALLMAAGKDGTAAFNDAHSYVNPGASPHLKVSVRTWKWRQTARLSPSACCYCSVASMRPRYEFSAVSVARRNSGAAITAGPPAPTTRS